MELKGRNVMGVIIKPGFFGLGVAADTRRAVFDSQNEQILMQANAVDVVFLGDSITETWMLDAYFRCTAGGLLVNRGIGGDRTPYMRRRFAADVLQLRPKLVVVLGGINNTWDMDDWDASLVRTAPQLEDEIVSDLLTMSQMAHEQGVSVAVGSLLPTNIVINSNTGRRNEMIKRLNARLQHEVVAMNALFVDYHGDLVSEDGLTLRNGIAADGLHPGARGYKLMADILLETLRSGGVDALTRR
jgi:lysophospholipase L1-like esterase